MRTMRVSCKSSCACSCADYTNGPPGLAYPGPKTWAGMCVAGQAQTPINIPLKTQPHNVLSPFGDLSFDMPNAASSILNTGHGTMQVGEHVQAHT